MTPIQLENLLQIVDQAQEMKLAYENFLKGKQGKKQYQFEQANLFKLLDHFAMEPNIPVRQERTLDHFED